MNPLNKQPKIVAMANALGLHGENRVEAIMEHCRQQVRWLFEHFGPMTNIQDVEKLSPGRCASRQSKFGAARTLQR